MINQLTIQLNGEGRETLERCMQQLCHAQDAQEILDAHILPGTNDREFTQKPKGRSDQGFRGES